MSSSIRTPSVVKTCLSSSVMSNHRAAYHSECYRWSHYTLFKFIYRVLQSKSKVKSCIAVNGTPYPSHSYGVSLAIWDHKVLPSTRHKRTHPAFTPARQSKTYRTSSFLLHHHQILTDLRNSFTATLTTKFTRLQSK